MALSGIAFWIENAGEVVGGEDAFGFGFEGFIAEQSIDAFGYPVRFENVGILENGVIAEVEN